MRTAVWIESAVLVGAGLVGTCEATRLIVYRNPNSIEDLMGPGRYLLIVSLLLVLCGLAYAWSHRRADPADASEASAPASGTRKVGHIAATMAVYIGLIQVIGYVWATPIFFALILRVFGIDSWSKTIAVSAAFSIGYYVVFISLLGMPFPRGALFE